MTSISEHQGLRIVFLGTPDFAAYILEQILSAGYNVVGVVTTPDKPAGRGHKLSPSAVKVTAQRLLPNVPLLQPERLRDENFLGGLRKLDADLFVVVAFRMLPDVVWSMPPRGTFNLHASLLPKYRGAAPIQYALLRDEEVTGVTTFFLDHEIDTGRIIMRKEVPIAPDDDASTLHDRLMIAGGKVVCDTIRLIQDTDPGVVIGTPQEEPPGGGKWPTAHKIFKEDRLLSFHRSTAHDLYLRVRALSPYPAALAVLEEEGEQPVEFKVYKSAQADAPQPLTPGQVHVTDDRRLIVGTTDGALEILELQMPSKRRTTTADYLLGHKLSASATLD